MGRVSRGVAPINSLARDVLGLHHAAQRLQLDHGELHHLLAGAPQACHCPKRTPSAFLTGPALGLAGSGQEQGWLPKPTQPGHREPHSRSSNSELQSRRQEIGLGSSDHHGCSARNDSPWREKHVAELCQPHSPVSGHRVTPWFPAPYADGGAPTSLGPQCLCEQRSSLTQTPDSGQRADTLTGPDPLNWGSEPA